MFSMILQSFWMPIRDFKDVVKIFWPLIIFWCVWFTGPFIIQLFPELKNLYETILKQSEPNIVLSTIPFLVWFYVLIVMQTGSVIWHRKIVLSEPVTTIRFWPHMRDWKYILCCIILFAVWTIIFILLAPTIYWPYLLLKREFLDPINLGVFSFLIKVSVIIFIFMVSFIIFIMLTRTSMLRLAHIAVEENDIKFISKYIKNGTKSFSWLFALFAIIIIPSTLPMLVMIILVLFGMVSISFLFSGEYIFNASTFLYEMLSFFTLFMAPLMITTLLSLFYEKKVRMELIHYNQLPKI